MDFLADIFTGILLPQVLPLDDLNCELVGWIIYVAREPYLACRARADDLEEFECVVEDQVGFGCGVVLVVSAIGVRYRGFALSFIVTSVGHLGLLKS